MICPAEMAGALAPMVYSARMGDPSPNRSERLLAVGLLILSAIIIAAQFVPPLVALWRVVGGL